MLTETLPTIFQQNVSTRDYKVLVVNNNSTDDTSRILGELEKTYENLSVINEKKQGLGYSKNTGMLASNTEWLVFLDDDAKVPNDFVKKAITNIKNSDFQCFGGVYLPWYKYEKPNWFLDNYASNIGKLTEFGILKDDFISGGIMAIKKSTLLNFKGFPTNVGMAGTKVSYGEETLLQIQLRKSGIDIGYDPNWTIYHLVNQYKLSPWWFLKSGFASGRDAWVIYGEKITWLKILIYFVRSIKIFFISLFKYTRKLTIKDYHLQNWIIDVFRPTILKFGQIYGGIKLIFK